MHAYPRKPYSPWGLEKMNKRLNSDITRRFLIQNIQETNTFKNLIVRKNIACSDRWIIVDFIHSFIIKIISDTLIPFVIHTLYLISKRFKTNFHELLLSSIFVVNG